MGETHRTALVVPAHDSCAAETMDRVTTAPRLPSHSGEQEEPFVVSVVCWGNICRSPMAEFMLRAAFDEAGLGDDVEVWSAGTSTEELGRPMDRRTLATLERHGVPDTGFRTKRARQFLPQSFDEADLVLAADHIHEEILRRRARTPAEQDRVRMLRSFDPQAAADGAVGMDDPWYGEEGDFDQTFREVEAAIPGIVEHVRGVLASQRRRAV